MLALITNILDLILYYLLPLIGKDYTRILYKNIYLNNDDNKKVKQEWIYFILLGAVYRFSLFYI